MRKSASPWDRQIDACYAEALLIDREVYGDASPEVAAVLHDQGNVYRARHDFDTAIAAFQEALVRRRAALGGHDEVASTASVSPSRTTPRGIGRRRCRTRRKRSRSGALSEQVTNTSSVSA
jgi:hypothetical protein